MSGSANNGTYGNSGYGNPGYGNPGAPNSSPWGPGSGWGQPGWDPWRAWYAAKPLWIAAMVLGFIFWWPVGLALLFFGIWSKRTAFWGYGRQGGWQRDNWQGGAPPLAGLKSFWCGGDRQQRQQQSTSTGNRAFDEYRSETLRRLEDEQKEFASFLERLRFAKDKSEFDQFMNERRSGPPAPQEPPPAPAQG